MAEIYWLTRLAGIKTFAIILLIASVIVVICTAIWYANTSESYMKEERNALMKLIKTWKSTLVCSLLFGVLGAIFIPTQPELAFLAYKRAKEAYIKDAAQKYYDKGKITERVYDALMKYEVEITD